MIDSKNSVLDQQADIPDSDEMTDPSVSGALLTDAYIDRLQKNAFAMSGMPDGDDYVHIFGHGYESSNFDAIRTLILNRMDVLSELPSTQHLEKILQEIQNRFHDFRCLAEQ
ncbi:MAG: hypothetical protein AB2823_13030 [Candidatus Thiodiazotropha endolucinida]